MRRRPTLKSLMIAIIVIGLGLAALVRPNDLWALTLPIVLLTMLLTAIPAAFFRRGPKRAFWTGFALFGWASFLLSFGAQLFPLDRTPLREEILVRLLMLPEFIMGLGAVE